MENEIIVQNGAFIKAELDTQIATARAYPRDVKSCMDMALKISTHDEETAASCFYSLPPRKDKEGKVSVIKGPSIRLAEIISSCWGNLHAATRVTCNDGKFVTVQGVAWDLERNVRISSEVQRSITYKTGQTYSSDMQAVTTNAAASIAMRNAIFRVVPRALIDRIYESAIKKAVGETKNLAERRDKVFSGFQKLGINSDKILLFFNKKRIDEFNSEEDIATLIGIGTSIKEGLLSADSAFNLDEESSALDVKARLDNLLEKKL